ncbi:hypothetical protein CERSUDRAFT_28712, partial [Gelatoporia subvermispora B]
SKVDDWKKNYRQLFLDELVRQDGFSGSSNELTCSECSSPASLRCLHCFSSPAMCGECMLERHALQPLHRIESWNGEFFEKTTLNAIGFTLQLGHTHDKCPHASKEAKICVVDTSGLHYISIRYCECAQGRDVPPWQQLLRAQLFPATNKRPRTVFTFSVLDLFHELTLQSKINLYDFYVTLERITDNTNSEASMVSTIRLVSAWADNGMLKRAARGHDPRSVIATTEGELAVECPACAHPKRNLPEGWESLPQKTGWIYTLFLMLDANFRIRCKDRGLQDSNLTSGWAYFVEQDKYLKHVAKHADIENVNACSAEHNAIIKANLHKKGYIASGVGAVLCGRHALVRKTGVGDLQKGEKFCNMDYLLLSTLINVFAYWLLITYDIACSFYKNFNRRNRHYRADLQTDLDHVNIRWAIPKEHLAVHGPNHSQFSLNFLPFVGRTYGEGIESSWAHINPVALSAQEMGPGMRHEVLDDHWGAWNWRKVAGMGAHLVKSHAEALDMHEQQYDAFIEYSDMFDPAVVEGWQDIYDAWIKDPYVKPDPFEEPMSAMTMSSLRRQLAEEDAAEEARGQVNAHEISTRVFMQLGLDLEEQMYVSFCVSSSLLTSRFQIDTKRAEVQEKRNALSYRIRIWRKIQNIYMPVVTRLREDEDSEGDDEDGDEDGAVDSDSLFLPSSLPANIRTQPSIQSLLTLERHLRIAQADDALDEIRRLRWILQRVLQFRKLNIAGSGAKPTTHVRSLYDKFQRRVDRAAATYRAAHAALLAMNAEDPELRHFKSLHSDDISGPGRDADGPGEGRYEMSWIWHVQRREPRDVAPDDMVSARVEWARAKARAERWPEETILLEEEMRRIVEFLRWKACWWRGQRDRRVVDAVLLRGLNAYAEKQAAVFEGLALTFARRWMPYLHSLGRSPKWFEYFPD